MKKILLILLAAAAAVTLFAGCSSPQNNPPSTEEPPEAAAPSDGTPDETPGGNPALPNPFTSYDTIEELTEKTGLAFSLPAALPEGFELAALSSVDQDSSKTAQASFSNGSDTIVYRMAQGTSKTNPSYPEDDLEGYITFFTGDYNQYRDIQTLEAGSHHVTLRGNDGKYSVAFWEEDGNSFSIVSRIPLDSAEIQAIIESIQ